ncbi:Mucin-like protein, partial [Globisporangium splendens]
MQVLRLLRVVGVAVAAAASLSSAAIQVDTVPAASNATSVNTATVADILSVAGNVTDLPGGNSLCGATRVRQPWGSLTAADQALYLEAVGIAVKNGALKQFADLYADEASGAQAEFSSAFFLWHRRLVLGFESYLRDLAPKFACLTVPYYDVHTAYVQSATKQCGSLYECSSIFKALGGQASTKETSLVYNGVNVTGYLHTDYPFTSDCDDSSTCGSYVRNDLTKRVVPPSAGFSTFQSLIASTSDYASFLEGIQFGLHNEVRDAIGGALTTFASPRDVFFYSWHAALDMYLHTYQLCRIGVPMTEADFKASELVFTNASESTGGISGIGPDSKLLFNVKVNGTTVDISEHPTFGKYFSYVGNEAWNYGDLQQLGDYSYTYELPEVLRQQLLTNTDVCTGFNRAFAATSDVSKTLTSTNITTKSTNITTTKTVTTTVIRNGTKYTTTTVTKTTVRRNTTTTTKSTLTSWLYNLTARFGYMYDLSDDSTYVEGYNVTNGYTGYNAYSTNGILTTKHQGIIVADTTRPTTTTTTTTTTKTNTIKGESIYSNITTVRANVTLNNVTTVRDVTASVATSGEYWVWFRTVYEGLKTRFEGNMDLVAQHLQLLEYNAYTSVYGNIANFSNSFVTNYHLTSKRSIAGQIVDDIKAGKYEIAASTTNFTSSSVRFVNTTVINRLITTYKRIVTRKNVTYLTTTYIKSAESAVKSATTLLIKSESSKTNASSTGSSNSTTTVVTGGVSITSNKTTTVSGGGQDTTTTTTTTTAVTPAPATTTTTTTGTPAPSTTTSTGTATPAPSTVTSPSVTPASSVPAATPASSTVKPAATPAASVPVANPASSVPAATPAASTVKPAATPAASIPAAIPAASVPTATPASSTVKPAATPAASVPAATPAASTMKPAATPAASTPNIIKVVVTPAPTSAKLVC